MLKLLGKWQGDVSGQPGIGKGTMEFKQVIKNKYIFYKNKVVFEPKEAGEEGEIHEEWGFYSIDTKDNSIKLRVFYGEGYVSYFSLIAFQKEKKSLALQTIHNENLPEKFLAKLTLELLNETTLKEKFELAPSGDEFKMCIVTEWSKSS